MKRFWVIGGTALIALLAWAASGQPAFANHATEHAQPAGAHRSLHGDPLVLGGLAAAAGQATGQRPRAIRDQLAAGQSIASIARSGGSSDEEVLAVFDQSIDARLARAVERGRLPQSVATARAAWYKQSARLQLDQPGLSPPFPGLHEMHGLTIGAASRASGIRRSELRARLATCATLEQIVESSGVTTDEVVAEGLRAIDGRLDEAVAAGHITAERRDEWRPALQKTLTGMLGTPGLHVAGKECAN